MFYSGSQISAFFQAAELRCGCRRTSMFSLCSVSSEQLMAWHKKICDIFERILFQYFVFSLRSNFSFFIFHFFCFLPIATFLVLFEELRPFY